MQITPNAKQGFGVVRPARGDGLQHGFRLGRAAFQDQGTCVPQIGIAAIVVVSRIGHDGPVMVD
jgi:hypothetical protein